MYQALFPRLSDASKLWIYAADRPLTAAEQAHLREMLAAFFDGWTSHRRPVLGDAAVLHDRFLVIAGEIPGGDVSGCGIDKMVHQVEAAATQQGYQWMPPLDIFYAGDDGVRGVPRAAFRQLARDGAVDAETVVYDLGVDTLGALRAGAFERPAGAGWHARVFRLSTAV